MKSQSEHEYINELSDSHDRSRSQEPIIPLRVAKVPLARSHSNSLFRKPYKMAGGPGRYKSGYHCGSPAYLSYGFIELPDGSKELGSMRRLYLSPSP